MNKAFLTAIVIARPVVSATPVLAMKGIDAMRQCEADPKCTLVMDQDGGGGTIIKDDVWISCRGPQAECTVISRPTRDVKKPKNRNDVMPSKKEQKAKVMQ